MMEQKTIGTLERTPGYLTAQDEMNRRSARLMQGMRALSEEEIAEHQRRIAPLMMNAGIRGGAELQNAWVFTDTETSTQEPVQNASLWRRLIKVFLPKIDRNRAPLR